jgi:nitrogenase subunit NifH
VFIVRRFEKMVIYKQNNVFYVTSKVNYNARIQNSRVVHKMSDFNSADEIIDYFCKHFNSKKENFEIVEG